MGREGVRPALERGGSNGGWEGDHAATKGWVGRNLPWEVRGLLGKVEGLLGKVERWWEIGRFEWGSGKVALERGGFNGMSEWH